MKARQSETNRQAVIEDAKKQKSPELLATKQADASQVLARSMAQLLKLDLPESLIGTGLTQTGSELAKLAQLYSRGLVHLN